ncbi:MAG: N-acetylmuramoyl-L-alanine amidase, partial [Chlamydiae bacterium]|nr:N-acetylmuramoyl-L-alanine amidase [Chlamydiota bacterium]
MKECKKPGVMQITKVLCCLLLLMSALGARSASPLGIAASAGHSQKNSKGPLVVIDAGHGGSDEGAKVRQLQEKSITLLTALYAKRELENMGYRVLLTRSRDIYVSLPKRVNLANKTKGTIFVSI